MVNLRPHKTPFWFAEDQVRTTETISEKNHHRQYNEYIFQSACLSYTFFLWNQLASWSWIAFQVDRYLVYGKFECSKMKISTEAPGKHKLWTSWDGVQMLYIIIRIIYHAKFGGCINPSSVLDVCPSWRHPTTKNISQTKKTPVNCFSSEKGKQTNKQTKWNGYSVFTKTHLTHCPNYKPMMNMTHVRKKRLQVF